MPTPDSVVVSPQTNAIEQEKQRRITETLVALNTAVDPGKLTLLSNKSLEDVVKLQEEIAAVMPVGNIAGLVLSGLTRLKGRTIPPEQAQRDVVALLRGLDVIPKALYGAIYASPAAVLYAYQKMLALAGKDAQAAFPRGLWQFYVEFSMREDSARHTNETAGFFHTLSQHNINLPPADQLSAWILALAHICFQYDDLLLLEWHERTMLNLLKAEAEQSAQNENPLFSDLNKKWLKHKPFKRGHDAAAAETYAKYRQRKFDLFCQPRLKRLPAPAQQRLAETYQQQLAQDGLDFQKQMSIIATLNPDRYKETHQPIPLWQTRLAIIWQRNYYFIPICAINDQGYPLCFDLSDEQIQPQTLQIDQRGFLIHPHWGQVEALPNGLIIRSDTAEAVGRLQPADIYQFRNWAWAIINNQLTPQSQINTFERQLLSTPRAEHEKMRKKLSAEEQQALSLLKMAPIILNWDEQNQTQTLSQIRLGQRGVGDHALTIFTTGQTIVFDQSHIFFDGAWGSAVAEILTNDAISWGAYLAQQPPLTQKQKKITQLSPLKLNIIQETSAENNGVDLANIVKLRQNLRQRKPDMRLTINDLLVLARSLFNQNYQPEEKLLQSLAQLKQSHSQEARQIEQMWAKMAQTNPILLIPIDATPISPGERLYPVTFRNPFSEIQQTIETTCQAFQTHREQPGSASWQIFNESRTKLLNELYYFGRLMLAHKTVTLEGHNPSLATIKLLGHLPPAWQKMLDQLPQRFDVLNEVLKGEEVFSNVGQVAPESSLLRFSSASDDNEAKMLVWGILTDNNHQMHISLRDFRLEVKSLLTANQPELAQRISQDFLDGYVQYLNSLVHQLNQIVAATM